MIGMVTELTTGLTSDKDTYEVENSIYLKNNLPDFLKTDININCPNKGHMILQLILQDEKFYLDGESRVTDEELKEFDEELEEDARRYQRQKLEDSYYSSEEDEWLDEHEDVDMDLPNIS